MTTRPRYYDALKVSPDAPAEVIRAAYRSLSQKHHPDRNADGAHAAQVMATLNQAYEVLSHPVKKREYDAWIRQEHSGFVDNRLPEVRGESKFAPARRVIRTFLTRKRVGASLSVIFFGAGVIAYSSNQERDSWLERAWHESWRGDMRIQSPSGAAQALSIDRLGPALEPANLSAPPLRWESSLNNNATKDARF